MERFRAGDCGPEWTGREQLAGYCEAARLTPTQAQAALHASRGHSGPVIRRKLRLDAKATRDAVRKAALRLAPVVGRPSAKRRREVRDLLDCLPNRRLADDKPQVERLEEMACDRTPTLPRARPFGTCAEDLLPTPDRSPLAYLQSLTA